MKTCHAHCIIILYLSKERDWDHSAPQPRCTHKKGPEETLDKAEIFLLWLIKDHMDANEISNACHQQDLHIHLASYQLVPEY